MFWSIYRDQGLWRRDMTLNLRDISNLKSRLVHTPFNTTLLLSNIRQKTQLQTNKKKKTFAGRWPHRWRGRCFVTLFLFLFLLLKSHKKTSDKTHCIDSNYQQVNYGAVTWKEGIFDRREKKKDVITWHLIIYLFHFFI